MGRGDLYESKNLDAVTSATNGDTINASNFAKIGVQVEVTSNTGAVTVTVQRKPAGGSTWANLDTETFTATNATRIYEYEGVHPNLRVITSTHSNATVSAWVNAREW